MDALADWARAAGPSDELSRVEVVTKEQIVAILNDTGNGEVLAIFGPGTRMTHQVPAGRIIQSAYLIDGKVVFGLGEDGTEDFWVDRWDPTSDTVDVLYESTGEDSAWSETAVDGSTMYLTAPGPNQAYCVRRMDLSVAEPRLDPDPVACVDADSDLGWLQLYEHTLSFQTLASDADCATVHRISLPDGRDEVVDIDGCVSRDIVGRDWVVWTEPPVEDPEMGGSTNFFDVPLRVRVGGTTYDLGSAVAGSTVICDGWLYWDREDFDPPISPEEIRRWRPGGPTQVVYVSPEAADGYATSIPLCGPGVLGVQRMGGWANAGQEFLTTPTLGWTAGLHPAAGASGG
ncbi:hypothetical protein Q6348_01935 [Isoptericola sp. b441]|uniref:DUF4185 domain-containing protein n=1 Tax=Actinotalea lenta TaxID=3064654 RepID=A0ABT9D792_9CELL|nr:hypothetical protein [Isoptericola sp. b441]MDO8105953.1 hypothetical protein [Isoptericola sp. b441]